MHLFNTHYGKRKTYICVSDEIILFNSSNTISRQIAIGTFRLDIADLLQYDSLILEKFFQQTPNSFYCLIAHNGNTNLDWRFQDNEKLNIQIQLERYLLEEYDKYKFQGCIINVCNPWLCPVLNKNSN